MVKAREPEPELGPPQGPRPGSIDISAGPLRFDTKIAALGISSGDELIIFRKGFYFCRCEIGIWSHEWTKLIIPAFLCAGYLLVQCNGHHR